MLDIINITAPIFIIIALGYLSVRTRIIDQSHAKHGHFGDVYCFACAYI